MFFVLFVWETNANLLYKEKQTNFVQSSLYIKVLKDYFLWIFSMQKFSFSHYYRIYNAFLQNFHQVRSFKRVESWKIKYCLGAGKLKYLNKTW
jgi:hypothetical protein